MLMIDTVLGASTHGIGLFTTRDLEAGTLVWQWDSSTEIIFDPYKCTVNGPFSSFLETYGYEVDGVGIVVNIDNARFMNHSDTPNLVEIDGANYTTTAIPAGTELTCDYRVFDSNQTYCAKFLTATKLSAPNEPYIITKRTVIDRAYNPNYGDDELCRCGCAYYRHFDTYEDMLDVGCKYCECYTFVAIPANYRPTEQELQELENEKLLEDNENEYH